MLYFYNNKLPCEYSSYKCLIHAVNINIKVDGLRGLAVRLTVHVEVDGLRGLAARLIVHVEVDGLRGLAARLTVHVEVDGLGGLAAGQVPRLTGILPGIALLHVPDHHRPLVHQLVPGIVHDTITLSMISVHTPTVYWAQ